MTLVKITTPRWIDRGGKFLVQIGGPPQPNRADRIEAILAARSTHLLLDLLNEARIHGVANIGYGLWVNYSKLKDVLATREHVPNKQERKAARQQAAQQRGHGRRR